MYFFFSGRNYHSYQRPQTTVPFFISGRNYEPAESSELVEPPQTFPLMARRLNLFLPDVIMNLPDDCTFFFQVVIIIPTNGQMTVPFFSGRNYEPTKTSELVESPARQLYLFFSGHNYHSYRQMAR
jgi:hypothetical protein